MNREQAKQLLPIIQAFADGADVQAVRGEGTWFDVENPRFYGGDNYRIKQKPLERWLTYYPQGVSGMWGSVHPTYESAVNNLTCIGGRVVHMREVME